YFAPTTLSDFEKKFGVKVNLKIYEDEEELLSNLQSFPGEFDIIVASDDAIREFIAMRFLKELDHQNIPNLKNIDSQFKNPGYDPGHKHSTPYMWGTSGVILNRKFIKEEIPSWAILWNAQYKGKVAMLNNSDEVIGAGLKSLGYSISTTDSILLEKAQAKLIEQIPLIQGYHDVITIRDKMISGELWAAQVYSGEGMFSVDKNEDLEYVIPKEGAAMWIDCLAIPKDAKHKYTAEVFINYILEAEVSAKIANYLWYANCNRAARKFTEKEILESPSLYPPATVLEKCEFFKTDYKAEEKVKYQQQFNKIWSELMLKKSQS
ncbi:spermidine/putrescine ABC transporter substrate-binding protein, partial [Candidatus Auribacterota bacterium]